MLCGPYVPRMPRMRSGEAGSREDIGQLFQISLPQDRKAIWEKLIEEIRPGSIVIQGANVSCARDIGKFVKRVMTICTDVGIPRELMPLIGITQEGGWISRVDDIANSPGNMALGACDSMEMTYSSYRAMGEELRACGVQWDLAPTVDVNTEPSNPIIGVRSFGDDPGLVSRHAVYAMHGLRDAGVLSCVKHFPGHGASTADSHLTLPEIGKGLEDLERCDLRPYAAAVEDNVDSIMISHIHYPHLEKGGAPLPASLSKRVVTGILRNRMGYDGLVLTDSLSMAAVADNFPMEAAAAMAIDAGVDVLECAVPEKYLELYDGLKTSLDSGRLKRGRIRESLARFRKLRRIAAGMERKGAMWSQDVRRRVTERATFSAVTEVNSTGTFSLTRPGAGKVHTVFFSRNRLLEERQSERSESPAVRILAEWGLRPGKDLYLPRHLEMERAEEAAQVILSATGAADSVIVFSNDALSGQAQRATPPQMVLAKKIASGATGRVAVVGTGTPYEAAYIREIPYIAAYSHRHDALLASVGVLMGAMHAGGRVPVTVPRNVDGQRGVKTYRARRSGTVQASENK